MKRIFQSIAILTALFVGLDLLCHLGAEILWFQEVGYLPAFLLRLTIQGVLCAIASGISAVFLFGNLAVCDRLAYPKLALNRDAVACEAPLPKNIGLSWLLAIALGLSLLLGALLFHNAWQVFNFWHSNINKLSNSPPLLPLFEPSSILQVLTFPAKIWIVGLLLGLAVAIITQPQFWLKACAIFISLSFGLIISDRWAIVLQYFHPTVFNRTEPLFSRDIGFYFFTLPAWELVEFWLVGLFLYCLIAVTLIYLLSGDSLSQGSFQGFSRSQQHHLRGLGCTLMLAVALSYWLRRYELLYSKLGVSYGASYTAVKAQLPAYTALLLISLAIAIVLLWKTIFPVKTAWQYPRLLIYGLGLYLTSATSIGWLLPIVVQRFIVQPNELARERPYIQRSIALTRQAFGLDEIEVKTFDPKGGLTYREIQENGLTINNIRLWDARPLLQSNRQLQQIRPYYKFVNADIDRYSLKKESNGNKTATPDKSNPISTSLDAINRVSTTERQQVILAARELDYSAVPQPAKTWVNEHLVYTHGYGFTMSPVNTVAPGGLPDYFVKDISGSSGNDGALQTASVRIRESIPISHPRIYYGEITNNYVMTSTKVRELDYPSGDENVYNIYDGRGGIKIGSWWHQLLFADYLKDWQMIFTRNFTPETRLLFRRNINERVRAIAPFLRYDSDPYLVVADVDTKVLNQKSDAINPDAINRVSTKQNYLYWIIDAYTASDRYPYSDPGKNEFNYIRNSVKVVIDAYNGAVVFYVSDSKDPIITTWRTIFPRMFKHISKMPPAIRSHIRYPLDLFNVQSERLLTYHMTNPQVFYNREDLWQLANEIYGGEEKPVEPYYLIMKLPTAKSEEFILLLPFTPTQRTNLIAWLAARSDGAEYGRLLLYRFPKQQLVYGTEQIEALINQDPIISQQISLWNRQGSKAIQGNLLVIPIERSLLYVEPLYLEAEQNSLPTLIRVIVAYENRIVMAETLAQALQAIFQQTKSPTPPIVRPVA